MWSGATLLLTAATLQAAPGQPSVETLVLRWSTSLTSAPWGALESTEDIDSSQSRTPNTSLSWAALLKMAEQSAGARTARAEASVARARRDQARDNALMPRVESSATIKRSTLKSDDGTLRTPTSSIGLTASMPLWRAADRATARASDAMVEQADWQLRQIQLSLAQELSQSWLDGIETRAFMRLSQAQLERLQAQVIRHERRMAAGTGSRLELLETRSRLSRQRAELEALRVRLLGHRLNIERLTGQAVTLPAGPDFEPADAPVVVPAWQEAQALVSERNPAWRDGAAGIRAATALLEARNDERWQPTLDAVAGLERQRRQQQFNGLAEDQRATSHTVGLQLSFPLYTGGVQGGRSREAAASLVKAQSQEDEARARVLQELHEAYERLDTGRHRLQSQSQAVADARASAEAMTRAVDAGLRSHGDVLDAQDRLEQARRDHAATLFDTLRAQVQIMGLLDLFEETRLSVINRLLETPT